MNMRSLLALALLLIISAAGFAQAEPSAILEYFDNPEHGDNGERFANLKAWAKGEDTFIEIGTFGSKKDT